MEAFKKGNDALAEQKLKEARDHQAGARSSRARPTSRRLVYQAVHPGLLPGRDLRRARAATSRRRRYLGAGAPRRARDTGGQRTELRPGDVQPRARSRRADAAGRRTSGRARRAPSRQSAGHDSAEDQQPPPTTTTATPNNPVTPTPSNNTGSRRDADAGAAAAATAEPAWLAGFRRAMDASRASLRQSTLLGSAEQPRRRDGGRRSTRRGARKRRRSGATSTRRRTSPRSGSWSARARRSGARTPPRRRRRWRRCATCRPGTWRSAS